MSGLRLPMRIWDLPTRLFHWALVLLVATSYLSAQFDAMSLHFLSGYALLAGLLFRLVWGVVGSDTSRFAAFLRSPLAGVRHLRDALLEAPLAKYVGKHASDALSTVHSINVNLILAAIAVHLAAIAVYAWGKRQNLLRPMITGKKKLPAATRAPRMRSSLLAASILLAAVAAVVAVARL